MPGLGNERDRDREHEAGGDEAAAAPARHCSRVVQAAEPLGGGPAEGEPGRARGSGAPRSWREQPQHTRRGLSTG